MQKISQRMYTFFSLTELAKKNTPVHKLHAMAKLLVTVVFLVCVISAGRYDVGGLTIYFFYPLVLLALSELPFGGIVRRILPALPFVLFAGISNIIFETELSEIGVSFGFLSFAVLLEKAVLSVGALVILTATTPSNQLLSQLQRLHVPRILTTTIMLCFRYLSLLTGEAYNMSSAYHLRSIKQNGLDMRHVGSFVGQLLLRSIDRAERVYAAMLCRGFDGTFTTSETHRMEKTSICYTILVSLALIVLRTVGFSNVLMWIGTRLLGE